MELPELPKLKFCVFCLPRATSSATEFAGMLFAAARSNGDHATLTTGSIAVERSKWLLVARWGSMVTIASVTIRIVYPSGSARAAD